MAIETKVFGGVDFNAYLKTYEETFAPQGRGAFSDGLSGDEYVLWSGADATIPVRGAQAFIVESGDDGDLAYDFASNTVSGTIDAIEFGLGVTDDGGDYSTRASVRIENLDLESAGADGIVNRLILDLMDGGTGVLRKVLKENDIDFTGTKGDDAFKSFAGDDDLSGGKGDDTLSGGAGDDDIEGGAGDDLLAGGQGSDTFEFAGFKSGADVIRGFDAGKGKGDVISFDDAVFSSFRDVIAAADQKGGSTIIQLDDGHSVTLNGVKIAELHKSDFIFD